MSTGFHRDISGDQNHVIHFREYANADERKADLALDASHLYKVALEKDTNTFWVLVDANPVTWKGVGSGGGLNGTIDMFWGEINTDGRPIHPITGEPDLRYGMCDGRTYTAPDGRQVTTPDMRSRFPMCTQSGSVEKGTIGGAASITQSAAQLAAHTHSVAGRTGYAGSGALDTVATTVSWKGWASTTGSSQAMENRPPFMQVPFIMYL